MQYKNHFLMLLLCGVVATSSGCKKDPVKDLHDQFIGTWQETEFSEVNGSIPSLTHTEKNRLQYVFDENNAGTMLSSSGGIYPFTWTNTETQLLISYKTTPPSGENPWTIQSNEKKKMVLFYEYAFFQATYTATIVKK